MDNIEINLILSKSFTVNVSLWKPEILYDVIPDLRICIVYLACIFLKFCMKSVYKCYVGLLFFLTLYNLYILRGLDIIVYLAKYYSF